jgi:predicted short-subunit dehydrogenase-like oxidoreductase (DUF2520 family)
MKTLNIIGAGRVGQTLGRLWQQCGTFTVQDVLTTRPASALAACTFMGSGTPVENMAAMRPADVWMLAVPDAAISATAAAMAAIIGQRGSQAPAMAFHCSGAQSSESLAAVAELGWHTASAHCILSFATAEAAVQQFKGTACALEGDSAAIATLHTAYSAIQGQCFEVAGEHKVLYHAAAVFATNFMPVLQQTAEDAWRATGVPEALLPHLRASLLQNAVANITRLGPALALTGPAARGDMDAIKKQAKVVTQWDAKAGAAYEALSDLALRMAKARSDVAATAASNH